MKTFTTTDTSGHDLVHMVGSKDDYTITENSGSISYESVSWDRKYVVTGNEEINFKRPDSQGKTKFKWNDEFAPFSITTLAEWQNGNNTNLGEGAGTLSLSGITTSSGYWNVDSVSDNITLSNMPSDNFELSFDIQIHNATTHNSTDGAGVIWFNQNESSHTAVHFNNSLFYFANTPGWQVGPTRSASTGVWYNLKIRIENGLASFYYNDELVSSNNNIGTITSTWNFSNYSHFDGNTNSHWARANYNNIKVVSI